MNTCGFKFQLPHVSNTEQSWSIICPFQLLLLVLSMDVAISISQQYHEIV